jgi:hypothetical protein
MSERTERGVLAFEQQPREGNKAFAAFRVYLDMGTGRSLVATAEKLGKCRILIERWSRKFDWPARVQAYMAHLAEAERLAIQGQALEKAVEWHQKHEAVRREAWREAEETIAMVRQARAQWLANGRTPGWEGMARMLELAFKLKQFAAGMPSEVKEVNTTVTGTIDIEWEAALRKTFGARSVEGRGTRGEGEVVEAEVVSNQTSVISAEPVKPAEIGNGGQR